HAIYTLSLHDALPICFPVGMRKTLAAIACASALTVPAGNVWAATQAKTAQKKKVVTISRAVTGPLVNVNRWGQLQLSIKVELTTDRKSTRLNSSHVAI